MEITLMTIHQTMLLLASTCLLGGCTATITPRGEIYTEAYLPAETVVVESYTTPVVVPVAVPRPVGPLASVPRHRFGGHQPKAVVHRPTGHKQPAVGHTSKGLGGKKPGKPAGPQGRR